MLSIPQKSELGMAAFSRPLTCESSCTRHATHEELPTLPPTSQLLQGAPSQATNVNQDEKFRLMELAVPSPTASPLYSLTYGPLSSSSSCASRTSRNHLLLGSASSTSQGTSPFSPPAESLQMSDEAPTHPFHRMKSLLSKLACGITTLKMAFSVMRVSSVPLASAESSASRTEKAMLSELQTLSNLQMRLYSLILQHNLVIKEEHSSTASASETVGTDGERKNAMLKSYEGIITRFHDEISQKDAMVEALKHAYIGKVDAQGGEARGANQGT